MPRQAKPTSVAVGTSPTSAASVTASAVRRTVSRLPETRSKARVEIDDNSGRPLPSLTVTELVALFLDNVKVERSIHTYLDYQRWLTEFAWQYGHRPARDVTRQDARSFRNGFARSDAEKSLVHEIQHSFTCGG